MGGFSSSVQAPQTGGSAKGGPIGDSASTPTFIADAAGIVNRQKDLEATPEFQEARRLEVSNPARPSGPSGGGKFGNQIAGMAQQVNQRPDGLDQKAIDANPEGFKQYQQQAAQQMNVVPQGGGDGLGGTGLSRGMPQPMGKGGRQTNSATSGQPRMGMQNQYPNTVGQWDNSQIQPLQPKQGGKGKGG